MAANKILAFLTRPSSGSPARRLLTPARQPSDNTTVDKSPSTQATPAEKCNIAGVLLQDPKVRQRLHQHLKDNGSLQHVLKNTEHILRQGLESEGDREAR